MTDIAERLQTAMDMEPEVNSFEAMRDAKAEIKRLNIRIRQDAEAALQHLNEIDQLTLSKAALQTEIERLRELDDKKWTEHVIEREELRAKLQACETHKNGYLKEVERLRDLDTASTKLCHSLDTENERRRVQWEEVKREAEKWVHESGVRLGQAHAKIEQLRRDGQALLAERNDEIARLRGSNTKLESESERLKAERYTTKRMLKDILDKHGYSEWDAARIME